MKCLILAAGYATRLYPLTENFPKPLLDINGKTIEPKSNWAVPPFSIYKAEDLVYCKKALEEDCDTDAPGSFISWLCNYCSVHAYEMPGQRYDIGNLESYELVKRAYSGIKKHN